MSGLKEIESLLQKKKPGTVLFISEFLDVGDYDLVRKSLQRLTNQGKLIRLSKGIYYLPKKDKILGDIYPSAEQLAGAIAKRDKARIIPAGAYAEYRLGLSSQIPMNLVYLTDGSARKIRIGKQSISFKKTSPKNLSAKKQLSHLIIQALHSIGKENINQRHTSHIKSLISDSREVSEIQKDMDIAPLWIRDLVLKIIKDISDEKLA